MPTNSAPDPIETRAIALVALVMGQSLISYLTGKGVLTPQHTNELFEIILQNLEAHPQADPAVDKARILLESLANISARSGMRSPRSPPEGSAGDH